MTLNLSYPLLDLTSRLSTELPVLAFGCQVSRKWENAAKDHGSCLAMLFLAELQLEVGGCVWRCWHGTIEWFIHV